MVGYAIADIGTNSVRLMLADDDLRPVEKRLISTRIGETLSTTGRLSEGGMARTLEALVEYKKAAKAHGAILWAFATSAVRDAANRQEFLDKAEEAGISIEVVAGETEGLLAFLGVGATEKAALIDIGGGSTEVAQGDGGRLNAAFSAPVGCVRALERFGPNPDEGDMQALSNWLLSEEVPAGSTACARGEKMQFRQALCALRPVGKVFAVSGTATCLASLVVGAVERYSSEAIQSKVVTREQIDATLDRLRQMTVEQRCAIPVLGERGDLILLGGVLLRACMDALGVREVTISDADNLEGYLRYRLANAQNE